MEPRIQYAQTADGVSIALWTLGEGTAYVEMPTIPVSHIQMEWQIPEWRRWYEALAQRRMVVRYDCRGAGLSDRDVTDFSLDAQVLDLEAVVDRLGLERFALLSPIHSGPVAIAYAARHPDRVSHLILWNSWARTRDGASPQLRALVQLRDEGGP
jgi:pimeloyl-ACP methyl ester carboxylesterase